MPRGSRNSEPSVRRPWAAPHETRARAHETWGKTHEAWGKTHEARGKAFGAQGKAFGASGEAFEAWGNTNRLSGRCWNGSLATTQAWFVSSEASGRWVESWNALPLAWNTMDQASFTLTQARDALTQARFALIEARFVAYEAWSGWARRGVWRCKLRWGAGLGGKRLAIKVLPTCEGGQLSGQRLPWKSERPISLRLVGSRPQLP